MSLLDAEDIKGGGKVRVKLLRIGAGYLRWNGDLVSVEKQTKGDKMVQTANLKLSSG